MITMSLGDPNVVENFTAIQSLKKLDIFTDEQLQEMYDKQVEKDMEERNDRK